MKSINEITMKNLKSKLSMLVLLGNSMIFANCSNSTPRSNVNPITIAGTTWILPVENQYSYIVFNIDSTFLIYYAGLDEKIFGSYDVEDGRIILHVTKGEFDDSFPEGSINRVSKEDYLYIIVDDKLCILEKGKVSQDSRPYMLAKPDWTPPPR